jgi:hypothetical protein
MVSQSIFGFLLLLSFSSFSQLSSTTKLVCSKDTVYIGLTNKIKLEESIVNLESVKADFARVSVEDNYLIVMPANHPGELYVTFTYKDSIVRRKFISAYLPKPSLRK